MTGITLPETRVLCLRRQGRALTLPVLLLLVLAAASGYLVGSFAEPWLNWSVGLGAVAMALIAGIGPVLAWLTNRVTITTRRVIVRRGFFVHRRSDILLGQVREVRSRRGPVQRLFRSGDIELLVGTDSSTKLHDLPQVLTVVAALQELIEHRYLDEMKLVQGSFGA